MSAYGAAVEDFRARKDAHFRAGRGPVDAAGFGGLAYFPPDEAWAFSLPLTRTPDGPDTVLDTNSGELRPMARLGTVTVPLPGGGHTLSVFTPPGEERPARVFLPFRDATSGELTYGAGRYLDAPLHWAGEEAQVDVDFNLAYHPYCAYGEGWTCPLPPRENWLPGAVTVGERLP